ncbi:MAG: hypothetical protein SF339_15515 [Blastocatellia bacterium]|nr:hypothetical protein [Blastocatellia bacterium]
MADPVREYLNEKGCAAQIVERGLQGLVENWEQIVQSVENGYSLGLDDYLNDMDVRQLIEESLSVATAAQRDAISDRVERADEQMRSLVERAEGCLWGEEVAEEEGWTARNNWWYFTRPLSADPELLSEIDDATSGD